LGSLFVKYTVSILLGGVLVWLAFRGEDWSDFLVRLESVEHGPLMGYVGLFTAAHLLRIFRWGVLVRALGDVQWRDILSAGAVGYMCIMVLPLRLGEFVRPYLVRGKAGVTASGALATVVVERVIDGLLFVALFFFFINMLPPTGNPAVALVKGSAWLAGAVFVGTLVVLVAAHLRKEQTLRLLQKIGNRINRGVTDKALGLLESFLEGLEVLPDKRRLGLFMVYTVIYWAALGLGMKLMADATHIPDLDYVEGFALLTVLTVGIMVPAGPGFTGTFELALKAGFTLVLLTPQSQANIALYTIVLHVAQLVVQVGIGSIVILSGQIRLGDISIMPPAGDLEQQ
jgi:uncharacterized protein (TIRG00374 family)